MELLREGWWGTPPIRRRRCRGLIHNPGPCGPSKFNLGRGGHRHRRRGAAAVANRHHGAAQEPATATYKTTWSPNGSCRSVGPDPVAASSLELIPRRRHRRPLPTPPQHPPADGEGLGPWGRRRQSPPRQSLPGGGGGPQRVVQRSSAMEVGPRVHSASMRCTTRGLPHSARLRLEPVAPRPSGSARGPDYLAEPPCWDGPLVGHGFQQSVLVG